MNHIHVRDHGHSDSSLKTRAYDVCGLFAGKKSCFFCIDFIRELYLCGLTSSVVAFFICKCFVKLLVSHGCNCRVNDLLYIDNSRWMIYMIL